MRKIIPFFAVLLCLTAFVHKAGASDTDLTLAALVGSGVDTGDGDNNPYQLQFGGTIELIIDGYVVGFRGVRTLGSKAQDICRSSTRDRAECDLVVNDLRSMGADLGYEWELAILHIGPRLGIGRVRERNSGTRAPYFDPGGVAEVEIGPFLGGVDIRYRFAPGDRHLDGLLAFAKLGVRF